MCRQFVKPEASVPLLDPNATNGFGGLYQAGKTFVSDMGGIYQAGNLATGFAGGYSSGSPFAGGFQGTMAGFKWLEGYKDNVAKAGGIANPILDKVFPGLGLLAGPMIGRFETKRSAGR